MGVWVGGVKWEGCVSSSKWHSLCKGRAEGISFLPYYTSCWWKAWPEVSEETFLTSPLWLQQGCRSCCVEAFIRLSLVFHNLQSTVICLACCTSCFSFFFLWCRVEPLIHRQGMFFAKLFAGSPVTELPLGSFSKIRRNSMATLQTFWDLNFSHQSNRAINLIKWLL